MAAIDASQGDTILGATLPKAVAAPMGRGVGQMPIGHRTGRVVRTCEIRGVPGDILHQNATKNRAAPVVYVPYRYISYSCM